MLYTCCNTSRNTWQCCGCGCGTTTNITNGNGCGCGWRCGWGNTTNTTNGANTTNNGCGCCTNTNTTNCGGGTTFTNGAYGIFFPLYRPYCQTRTNYCGMNGSWTNGCCGYRQNLCTTNTTPVMDGDAYYARQYGLNGCGCLYGCNLYQGQLTQN